jgi:hypothetical protein
MSIHLNSSAWLVIVFIVLAAACVVAVKIGRRRRGRQ